MVEKGIIKILIGKLGLDGHDRGAKVLTSMLREAGTEVVYTGLYQTPEKIVRTAIQEDVDVIGMSFLSGEHMYYVPRVMKLLKRNNADSILVVVGGVIPADDIPKLKKVGAAEVFPADTPVPEIINFIKSNVHKDQ